MKPKIIRLTAIALILSAPGVALAAQSETSSQSSGAVKDFGPPGGPGFFISVHGGFGRMMFGPIENPMMATFLGLSDDQESQIRSIRESGWAAMKPLMQQERALRSQLTQLVEAPTFDQAKVQALAQQMVPIQIQMTVVRAQTNWKIFNILTPDQQAKLNQFQQEMKQRMQNRMNRRPPAP
jgi:protein CpxP